MKRRRARECAFVMVKGVGLRFFLDSLGLVSSFVCYGAGDNSRYNVLFYCMTLFSQTGFAFSFMDTSRLLLKLHNTHVKKQSRPSFFIATSFKWLFLIGLCG